MSASEHFLWNQITWDEEGEKHVQRQEQVHQLATSIRKRFEILPPLSSKCCIYRTPQTLRDVNKTEYSPCLVSIGPFHRAKTRLIPMQEQKLRYLRNFLNRNFNKSLVDYLRCIRKWENQIREFYIEVIEMKSEEFVEMVLLDSIFVIEFCLMWYFDEADETDRIFEKPSLECVIRRDILLLENQLPFFVLDGLYEDIANDNDNATSLPSFKQLCCEVLVGCKEIPKKFIGREILHLLDFVRTYYLPSLLRDLDDDDDNDNDNDDLEFPPSIEVLYDAGVKFEVVKNEPLLDITFVNGVLRIPKLEVEDHTESLLLNLSAFEQCHYFYDSYMVDYVVLMDVIITSLKDCDVLMSNGIVTNSLGTTEDLADVFNTICKGATYRTKGFYYSQLCKQLNAYAKAPWNKWRTNLNHDYFSNPWAIISVIVAFVLLILTVIQTYCTVVSMKK